VVGALQLAPVVGAPLAEGHELAASHHNPVLLQQGVGAGATAVEIPQVGHQVPALLPVFLPALHLYGSLGRGGVGRLSIHAGEPELAE
jgi:hypothetical protein